jgi:molybdate transport system substrate-binding protein
MNLRRRIALVCIVALVAACRRRGAPTADGSAAAIELRVAAASSLSGTIEALAEAYARSARVHVVPVFGATGSLARQIEQGLPVDLFFSADAETPARLTATGNLVPDTVGPFAHGVLVLYARSDTPVPIASLGALSNPAVRRIAIANPEHAPFGRAAREVLSRTAQWDSLSSRIVTSENVREAFEFARTGNADAAFTARSVVLGSTGRVTAIDPTLYVPIVESLGVTAHAEHPADARAFAAFVRSDAGGAVLTAHGFAPAH